MNYETKPRSEINPPLPLKKNVICTKQALEGVAWEGWQTQKIKLKKREVKRKK
jgi:hypothetical protein